MSAQYCCFEPLEGICCQISPLKGALLEQISEGSADRTIMTNESLIITYKAQKSPQLLDSSWGWPIQHGLYFGEVCGHPLMVDNVPQILDFSLAKHAFTSFSKMLLHLLQH